MNEQMYIDPYSHPDSVELSLSEAAREASRKFADSFTGKSNGIIRVTAGNDRICFYVNNEKIARELPTFFRGQQCEVHVVEKVSSLN